MKTIMKLMFVFILSLSQFVVAQEVNGSSFFTKSEFGLYGGINLSGESNLGGLTSFEFKTDLTSNLNLRLSVSYFYLRTDITQQVKSFTTGEIQGEEYFTAGEYTIKGREYKNVPISVGLQYFVSRSAFSPYVIAEGGYNFIDGKLDRTPGHYWSYNSAEEIPDEYKHHKPEPMPLSSFRYGIGIGAMYPLSNMFNLDVRYLYNFDSEIVNTHQVLVGFVF